MKEKKKNQQGIFDITIIKIGLERVPITPKNLICKSVTLHDSRMPFKGGYQGVQLGEVHRHLEEMIFIRTLQRSSRLKANMIVLFWKRDRSLRFHIDLHKLDKCMVKDVCSVPRIEDSLDHLNEAKDFHLVDLKSGYRQMELTKGNTKPAVFALGPLGYCEGVQEPFGVTNLPAALQRLIEGCLGEYISIH